MAVYLSNQDRLGETLGCLAVLIRGVYCLGDSDSLTLGGGGGGGVKVGISPPPPPPIPPQPRVMMTSHYIK